MSGSVYLTVLWLVINETEAITYHKAQLRQQKSHHIHTAASYVCTVLHWTTFARSNSIFKALTH